MSTIKDDVIGLIYDAALEPKKWPQLLNELLKNVDSISNQPVAPSAPPLSKSLAMHFKRAEALASRLYESESKSDVKQSMADLLPLPALIVDGSLNVHSANTAFGESIKKLSLFGVNDGVFTSTSNTLLCKLKEQISLLTADSKVDYLTLKAPSEVPSKPVSLLISRTKNSTEKELYLILIASFTGSNIISEAVLSELYGLTKAEQRLAIKIANGDSLSDIAIKHNTSIHTLRTQLKTIFSKIGVRRQSELVSALFTSSLVNFRNNTHKEGEINEPNGTAIQPNWPSHILSDGRTLAYAEYGDLNGEPVIAFHPTTGSKLQCHPNNELTRSYGVRLILIDRPGFGLSSRHEARSFLSFADDVEELASSLRLQQFSLLGYCGGGPYSLACAYKLASRVKHLTIVSGVTPYKDIDLLHGTSTVNRLLVKIATVLPDSIFNIASIVALKIVREPEFYLDELQGALCETDRAALNEPEFLDNFMAALADSLKQGPKELAREQILFSQDWGFDVAKIRNSIDFWYGDQDKHVPIELAQRLSTAISSAEFHQIENYGHFMIYHKWSEILEQHMAKIRATPARHLEQAKIGSRLA